MFAALDGTAKHRLGLPVTIKTKQAKDGARASSNHIQTFICRDQFIGQKLGSARWASSRNPGSRKFFDIAVKA